MTRLTPHFSARRRAGVRILRVRAAARARALGRGRAAAPEQGGAGWWVSSPGVGGAGRCNALLVMSQVVVFLAWARRACLRRACARAGVQRRGAARGAAAQGAAGSGRQGAGTGQGQEDARGSNGSRGLASCLKVLARMRGGRGLACGARARWPAAPEGVCAARARGRAGAQLQEVGRAERGRLGVVELSRGLMSLAELDCVSARGRAGTARRARRARAHGLRRR